MKTRLSYSIQNHIRSGAFGKVFRAVKKDTNETIALKMIKNNFESSFLKILNLSFKFISIFQRITQLLIWKSTT
jgi:serine/threonine protein kinase